MAALLGLLNDNYKRLRDQQFAEDAATLAMSKAEE
jgi:hypothetical protein